jgi:hypothetical protein
MAAAVRLVKEDIVLGRMIACNYWQTNIMFSFAPQFIMSMCLNKSDSASWS